MTNPLRFKGEYFLTKEELTKKLKEDLKDNGGENLPEVDNVELYELYCQNLFERFGLPNDENKDRNEALADISVLFEIGKVLRLNVSEYISIESIEIPLLNGEIKRTSVGSFSILSPIIKLDSVDTCDAESQECIFSFKYKTLKTANQIVSPTLFFYEGENKTRAYETTDINLSYERDGIIEFKIPLMELIQNNAGIYIISCDESKLCRIDVPKIKLPLGNEGVSSYEELISFLDWKYQDWTPSGILLPFYDLVRYRVLDTWLRDKEKNLKEQLDKWDAESHNISINDLNKVLELLGSTAKIYPCMHDYFDIEILDICSESCFYKEDNCYFKWDSCDEVNISFKITPKIKLNINFNLGIRLSDIDDDRYISIKLKEPILFNLENITEEDNYSCSFNSNSFSSNKMGYYYLEFVNNASTDDYKISIHRIVLAGESVIITLPTGEEMKMIGIPGAHDFYIAANPITQKQLKCLIGDNTSRELKSVLAKSQSYFGNNGNSPATFFSYSSCEELINALNHVNTKFHFRIPSWNELALAFTNGVSDVDDENFKISFPTKLGVSNLPGVGLLQTSSESDSIIPKRILFGNWFDEKWRLHVLKGLSVVYKESKFSIYESQTGFSPIMVLKNDDDDDDEIIAGTIDEPFDYSKCL